MEAKDLKHGPIEALITADEETGMFGANDLEEGILNADILLNLDSEAWGKFVIGSAGGVDIDFNLVSGIFGDATAFTRVIYALVGLSGLYMISLYGRACADV